MANIELNALLCEAIGDFQQNPSVLPANWLHGYLAKQITQKTAEQISVYSDEIIDTVDLMEKKQAEMNAAMERGISAENWMVREIMQDAPSTGAVARGSAMMVNELNSAQNTGADVIDIDAGDWSDETWNEYKLKDTMKGVAREAGAAGLREIASDVFQKAAADGIDSLADTGFLAETAINGAQTGLKYAVSAGLAIAEDRGVISELGSTAIGAIAHRTIESTSALADVARGKRTMSEALEHIKNTAVATITGIVQRNKERITNAVGTVASKVGTVIGGGFVGKVFGTVGAGIAGAVTGLLSPKKEGSKVKTVLHEAKNAVVSFLTQDLPSFSTIKEKAKNALKFLFG